jgi:enoyl-CoA hydratase/carnithine racemase
MHPANTMLEREDKDGIVTLTMNRPRQLNALSEALLDELGGAFEALRTDADVRCVVLSSAGTAFCAGHDLREMRGRPDIAYYRDLFQRCSAVMQAIQRVPVPVIARVHGLATAAGCQFVAACDLAIAASSARFAVSGINLGLFCATPSVALTRNVQTKRAFDMLMTGRFIDAATAADYGLVNEVVADDALDAAVAAKAATIAAKAPAAVRTGKALFYRQREAQLAEAYAMAGEAMAQNMMDEDTTEGIDAFLEKRQPAAPRKSA